MNELQFLGGVLGDRLCNYSVTLVILLIGFSIGGSLGYPSWVGQGFPYDEVWG